jgi:diguanylate cyclase (GGDEF)-like protein
MSIAIALGIVAIVNLALGYALALVVEAERNAPTIAPLVIPPTATLPAGVSPLLPVSTAAAQATYTTPDAAAQHELTNEPSSDDTQLAAKWSAELTDLASQMNQQPEVTATSASEDIDPAIADPALAISELQPERVETTAETIAHCEHLLDETESLVSKHLLISETDTAADTLEPGNHATASDDTKATDAAPKNGTQSTIATPTYEPRQPRATLLDAAQLEATLNDWWQNDPSHTQPLCVAQIEIDNLRQLTADCGTLVAGNISRQLENLLLAVLRRDDSLATLGRSRFLAILPGVDVQTGVKLVEEARVQIASLEFVQSGRALLTTVTAAVAQTLANESQEQLLARAAKALVDARAAGRNRVAWHDGNQARMHPATEAESRQQLVLK